MHVTFRLNGGGERAVEATEGETLMRAAVTSGVPGIEGECNGELNCGTCHVFVDQEWWATLPTSSDDEDALLEVLDAPEANSRLACQIRITPELEGLIVTVAPE